MKHSLHQSRRQPQFTLGTHSASCTLRSDSCQSPWSIPDAAPPISLAQFFYSGSATFTQLFCPSLKAASEATRVVTTELVAVLSDLAHQQSLITGAVVSDPDADAPSHRTVLQLAAVNRTLTGSPSLARALPLGGYQGSPTGHASPRNSVDSVLHTTIVSAATTSPAPASSTPAAAGAASRSAFEPAAGAGAIAGRSAGHASLVGGAPSLARNHSQREAYPDRVVLHRLAAVGLQAQVSTHHTHFGFRAHDSRGAYPAPLSKLGLGGSVFKSYKPKEALCVCF